MKTSQFILRLFSFAGLLGVLLGFQPDTAVAQFKEDILRLSTPGFGVGARSLGMGNAYTGIASDYSAIYWNPAGLAQARHGEFSFGLSYLNNKDAGTFLGGKESYTNNATTLNSLGLVYPVPVRRGALAIAFGFQRQAQFTSGLSFEARNPSGSILQMYAPDGAPYPNDLSGNLAYQLFLADIDTTTGRFISPIAGQLTQSGEVTESGGLNNWSVALAVDFAKNFSGGVTLSYVTGSYRYDRTYREEDVARFYESYPYDFDRLTIDEFIEGDISGVNAKFGLMFRVPELFRLGVAIKTPTAFAVKESFGTSSSSYFDNGDVRPSDGPFESDGSGEYDVNTPWVFSAGGSVILGNLVLSGDVDYTDWTEMEFSKANEDLLVQNKEIKQEFRATANLRAGAEFNTLLGLRLRGGFILNQSPYKGDPSSFDQKYITGGLGIEVGESSMIDLGYARGWWNTFRVNYDGSPRVDEKIVTNTFLLTFAHRF